MNTRRVAVLGGVRIPFARQNGPYARASEQDMLTTTLDTLAARFGLEGQVIGEVVAGMNPGRTSDREITIFDSTGLSIQDMAVAHNVYTMAIKENVGTDYDL